MRLDAADQSWHLSTPAPYDPPLTYGGWNQCRTLGTRIASLLHAREEQFEEAQLETASGEEASHPRRRRRRKKHKVVIHTSPFLRCVQTSVAISAGMAQFEEDKQKERPKASRSPATMHSASPRLHAISGSTSPNLAPIVEPKLDLAHQLARRSLYEHKRYRKAKIRVDAFLGEWLNPQYFDHITPPPPSPMMLAGAKAELLSNEAVDLFTPTPISHKSSNNSLWSGNITRPGSSRESPLDDWSHVTNALQRPSLRRQRSNSASSVGSNDSSASGRKSPFRPGHHGLQPMASTIPKPEYSVYHPPTPSYAISNSDHIPRGYVSHARNATVNVDVNWDSSRPPLNWGNGGEFGEEWSSMHKRFRRGLNSMIEWYSQHNADDRGEDALGFEQAERLHLHYPEEEEEDLVVILVTHGAGSNALIGALTAQPVLLDVGMASLTMAVRKEGIPAVLPPLRTDTPTPEGTPVQSPGLEPRDRQRRTSSLDMGLSAVYEMKLVSSSEHLRPGIDPTKLSSTNAPASLRSAKASFDKYKRSGAATHAGAGAGIEASWDLGEPKMSRHDNTSRALGSIRRPSAPNITRTNSEPVERYSSPPPPAANTGLWTPPATSNRGTPTLNPMQVKEEKRVIFSQLNDNQGHRSPNREMAHTPPPESQPTASNGHTAHPQPHPSTDGTAEKQKTVDSVTGEGQEGEDEVGDLPKVGKEAPSSLSRGLSVKGLWGNKPSGDNVTRTWKAQPKRRWTVNEQDQ